jgi:hypothetical protein
MTAAPHPIIDEMMDTLTVDQCCDGLITFTKLSMPERDAVVERMGRRGYGVRAIAVRCHGTVCTVQDAVTRVHKRRQEVEARDEVA